MDIGLIIRIGHVVGTVLGVGGATMAEIFYLKAMRDDGKIDEKEGGFLKVVYSVLRWGMVLLVLSGFGFLILYRIQGVEERLYNPRLWAKLVLTLIIVINALLLQTRKISFPWGSAISLTSWYAALVLGLWRGLEAGFWEIMLWIAGITVVVYLAQGAVRKALRIKV